MPQRPESGGELWSGLECELVETFAGLDDWKAC